MMMAQDETPACYSDTELSRFHGEEMTAEEETRVRAHLRECQKCAQRDAKLVARLDDQVRQVRKWRVDEGGDAAATQSLEAPRDDSPPPSIQIEGYDLVRVLGDGGQGVVYQAVQLSTKRKVAIKVLWEGPHASESSRRRFEREIEVVAQLKHHNIIPIFHSGKTPDGHDYCVMDYIRGVPLNHYVRDTKPTLEESLALFSKVCIAVNYAHQKGVIHRDLKPSNILVDAEGEPKLLDFGLAKMVSGPVQTLVSITGQVVGTLPYMSPEQTRGNPDEIDIRTDVYALGVMFYESLTGHYPYPVVGGMAEVFKHITDTEPTPPSRQWTADSGVTKRATRSWRAGQCPIDDDLQTIILKTLSKQRDRRYQSAGELARDFDHYLAGEPIEAKRDSAFYVIGKALQRHKAVLAAAGTILLLVSSLAYFVWREARQSEINRLRDSEQDQVVAAANALADAGERLYNESPEEAIEKFNQALRLDPASYKALGLKAYRTKEDYFQRPFEYRDRFRLREAIHHCDSALAIKSDAKGLWNLKAVLLYSLDDFVDAEKAARKALECDPTYFYASSTLAKSLALQRRFRSALEAAEQGMRSYETREPDPSKEAYDDDLWRTLGTIRLHRHDPNSISALEKAKEIDDDDRRTNLMLARVYLTSPTHKDHAKALEEAKYAEKFTRLHDPRFDRVLAQAYLATKDFIAAARHAESAKTKQDEPAAYSHLIAAIAYAHMKQQDAAKKHLDHANESWPEAFKAGEEVIVSCEKGLLWFDTRAELEALRGEAKQLLTAGDGDSKP